MPRPLDNFEPHPLLKNGHAMTMAAAFAPRRFKLAPAEDRLFQVDRDSQILGRCHWQPRKRRDVPVIAVVHGLEGSSESNYMLGIAEKAAAAGFHAIRLNQRNCGATEHLTPTLYNSGMSSDFQAVLQELSNGDGFEQVFFAGYSMGGNLVTKMAGEFGGATPKALRAVCTVCPAIDLAASADALERPENFFYERHFVRSLMAHYAKKARMFPALYARNGFGSVGTVRQFDDKITAPVFGFKDAQEYYEAVGAKKLLAQVRVPLLMITAKDDPFVPYESFQRNRPEQNPAIHFVAPEHGGHCGFISRRKGAGRFWAEQTIVDFCRAYAVAAG
ncbi:MAG TPA: alpha/beta fold hydrolase [Candidatus Acidoferrum sp.]|nr:alpha/beta fold hydrolase [Candidatus Acidoferrum sp.]